MMAAVELASGGSVLLNAARGFFEAHYGKPVMYFGKELHRDLAWVPALRFTIGQRVHVFVEPSETGPYPRILQIRNADVLHFPQPIAVYAVCPEEAVTRSVQLTEMKRLQGHGFGLLTVNAQGQAHRMFGACPLVQVIPQAQFSAETRTLPPTIRRRVSEAFDDYRSQPVNGVRTLSEIMEGLVVQAGKDASKAGHISNAAVRGSVANLLDTLHQVKGFGGARGDIGGARRYIKEYRNPSHHWPRNRKEAHQKYANCRHAFLEGIIQIREFRMSMKKVGLSGSLARV